MTFEEWLFEIENYGTRMERFLSEWDNGMSDKGYKVGRLEDIPIDDYDSKYG